MSGKQIITDWVMVPLVLVVLIGGFAMNIKAVENKNADLSKKLDAVHAELTALKRAQKNVVVKTAPAAAKDARKHAPDVKKDHVKKDHVKKDDVKKDDANDGDTKKQNDDDDPADVPL